MRLLRRLWRWLTYQADLGYVAGWNQLVADQHAENTERLLLGACGQSKVELSAAQRARRREQGA